MKTFTDTTADLDAGKVIIPVWNTRDIWAFRDDRGKYVFRMFTGFYAADTLHEIVESVEAEIEQKKNDGACEMVMELLQLPIWQAIDTTLPTGVGVRLLELRDAIEAGEIVSPLLLTATTPVCIEKSKPTDALSLGYLEYTPSPFNDVVASYSSVDEIAARNFLAHLPIWVVGKSPAYEEMEAGFHRQMEEREREEDALDNAPPRTVEMTEREYRALLANREHLTQVAAHNTSADDNPFSDVDQF